MHKIFNRKLNTHYRIIANAVCVKYYEYYIVNIFTIYYEYYNIILCFWPEIIKELNMLRRLKLQRKKPCYAEVTERK